MDMFRDTASFDLQMSSLTQAEVMVHPARAGQLEKFQIHDAQLLHSLAYYVKFPLGLTTRSERGEFLFQTRHFSVCIGHERIVLL